MTLPAFLTVLITALAAYRLQRVVTADTISDPFRGWVWRKGYQRMESAYDSATDTEGAQIVRSRGWRWFYLLVSCPWCLGFHVSIATYAAWVHWPSVRPFVAAVAVAGVQGLLASRANA